jgi:hypothetical protein
LQRVANSTEKYKAIDFPR